LPLFRGECLSSLGFVCSIWKKELEMDCKIVRIFDVWYWYEFFEQNVKNQRKMIDNMKKMDKGYHKFKRMVKDDVIKVEVYNNPRWNGIIRDAVSGKYIEEHHIGTYDEDYYFKVCMSNLYTKDKENVTFFFDTPEQCERHLGLTFSTSLKENWRSKNQKQKSKYQENHKN
jgi:hypothetical protein